MVKPPVVYTVKSASFSVGGSQYDVSTVSLSLTSNGIPSCAVGISATKSSGGEKKVVVHPLSLQDLGSELSSLQSKAVDLAPGSLNISIEPNGQLPGVNIGTSLSLNGWLLASVGLSRVTTTSSFSLVCTIVHPAYKLMLETGIMPIGAGVVDPSKYVSKVTNPITASVQAMEMCKASNDGSREQKILGSEPVQTGTRIKDIKSAREAIKNRISSVISNTSLLSWDGGSYVPHSYDIPGQGVLTGPGMLDGIKLSLLMDWFRAMTSGSYWGALKQAIAPAYGLEIIPTYDKGSLVLSPAMPWKNSGQMTIEVKDEITYAVSLPGQDSNPIFGYMSVVDTSAPAGGLITVQAAGAEGTQTIQNLVPFVPNSTSSSNGKLSHVRAPDWITSARQRASQAKKTTGVTTPGAATSGLLAVPPPPSSGENEQLKKWNPGVFMHLCNLFQLEYKATVSASLQCAFFTSSGGKTLIPGQRLKFTAQGRPLFYGTVSEVFHLINCASSSAETQIKLSHCTFPGAADAKVLGGSVEAPYYGASGSVEW